MAAFETYKDKYASVRLERNNSGVLEVKLTTDDGPLVWGPTPHDELGCLFADIRSDRANRALVITGTGDSFIAKMGHVDLGDIASPVAFERTFYEGCSLVENLLNIDIPVIAGVNGPATIHPEIAVMSDIVVASDTATFQDAPHFMSGIIPGDGAGVVWQHLLGPNRGRYFLLMGETLTAHQALELGVVGEVVTPDRLLDRCHEIAEMFAAKPDLVLRYTRQLMTQRWKREVLADLKFGFMMEGAGIAHIAEMYGATLQVEGS